jgi:hypothetical protein
MDRTATAGSLLRCLAETRPLEVPFHHWRPRAMLDGETALALSGLEISVPGDLDLSSGRRETNNKTRMFFDQAGQRREPAMRALAEAMQTPEVVAAWERTCGIDLTGTYLRIEYCRDTDGFWLEPHTDIGAKRITIMNFLSVGEDAAGWGTDIYDSAQRFFESVPGDFNCGLIFVPGTNSYHGFERRPIHGVRRSLMLNYVGPEWRSRHELCFPDQPVKS